MKPNGIQINVHPTSISVQSRSRQTPSRLLFLVVLLAAFWGLGAAVIWPGGPVPKSSFDLFDGILFLAVPVFYLCAVFVSSSGEILHCDSSWVLVATRSHGVRVRRESIPLHDVTQLEYAAIAGTRSGAIMGLHLRAASGEHKLFANMKPSQATAILAKCKSLGVPVSQPQGMTMTLDIEKDGWLVNPWRRTSADDHPKE